MQLYSNLSKKSFSLNKLSEKNSYFLLDVLLPVYGWYHMKIQVIADPGVLSIYRKWDVRKGLRVKIGRHIIGA